ncbi:unnamed protein product [Didymodactylos carnosus]|uniref:Uncharacterized protein n=1 Tax=Didymodactylos carnosus TaxID=1234261 RepID=A0A815QNB9_9BILA|nr:unnamed protein product [Didymodactylos carnosus]CAF1465822.1 unnamed protein product [Didymodactylos carnosus]CAF4052838.1 unnamed protein product [Didymodactylos carnosus]CAF4334943.1 unnamed protein product [Didymodactylos carnosus]
MGVAQSTYFERHQKETCILAVIFASIGLLLLCVGVGTPSWNIDYDSSGTTPKWYTTFYYTCYATNNTCWYNQYLSSIVNYYEQPLTQSTGVSTDYYVRLRNAAGLAMVGLLLIPFGLIAAIFLSIPSRQFKAFSGRLNLIAAFLLAIAALFQGAALCEGQHQLYYNGYSANLYQTGHALTICAIPLCAFVAGKIYF